MSFFVLDSGLCQALVSGVEPSGIPRLAVYFKREEGGKGYKEASSNQLWPVPDDNGTSWGAKNPPPIGATPFLIVPDTSDLQVVENRLVTAKNNQLRALAEIEQLSKPSADGDVDSGTVTEGNFAPADANKDGVVTPKEQKQFDKKHGK